MAFEAPSGVTGARNLAIWLARIAPRPAMRAGAEGAECRFGLRSSKSTAEL